MSASLWDELAGKLHRLRASASGLLGEVFLEEKRERTRFYESLLALLCRGVWRTAELAYRLNAAGLLRSPSPSSVTGALDTLEKMGLVHRLPLWKTRGARVYYKHASPAVHAYGY